MEEKRVIGKFLFVLVLLFGLFVPFVLAELSDTSGTSSKGHIDSTQLAPDEVQTLNTVKEVSNASIGFVDDTVKGVWPVLKKGVKDPVGASKSLFGFWANKTKFVFGVTNIEGRNITFYHDNELLLMFSIMGILIGGFFGFIVGGIIGEGKTKLWGKGFLFGILAGLGVGIFLNYFNFGLFLTSGFWSDFSFLVIVWIFIGILQGISRIQILFKMKAYPLNVRKSEILTDTFNRNFFKREIKRKYILILVFSALYFFFQSIPILNVGMYFLTLKFLGWNNGFFTWFIRPLIIAFFLFYIQDISSFLKNKHEAEKKFEDALKKKAIEEMNVASLRS